MPYRKIRIAKGYYKVINTETGQVKARKTTLVKAEAQIKLLHGLEWGTVVPKSRR